MLVFKRLKRADLRRNFNTIFEYCLLGNRGYNTDSNSTFHFSDTAERFREYYRDVINDSRPDNIVENCIDECLEKGESDNCRDECT